MTTERRDLGLGRRILRPRRFVVASAAFWATVLLLWGAYALFGHGAIETAVERGRFGLQELPSGPNTTQVTMATAVVDRRVSSALVILTLLYAATAAVYGLIRLPVRLRYTMLLLPPAYLAFELWATPLLIEPLGLQNYFQVRDVDHLPTETDPADGWNSDSVRSKWQSPEFTEDGMNLIFLGDSFTFGDHLTLAQSFPRRVEQLLDLRFPEAGVKVANFGWRSASPLLSHRRLQRIGERYEPDLVVLCLDMSDFFDDIIYGNMLERRGIYWYYDKIPLTLKLLESFLPDLFWKIYWKSNDNLPYERFFITEHPLEETRKHFEPTKRYIQEVADTSAELGARFVLIILPRAYQYSARESPRSWENKFYTRLGPHALEPFRYFEELKHQVNYPIYPILKDFQETDLFPTCFEDDPHWNPTGTSVAAVAIAKRLTQELEALLE